MHIEDMTKVISYVDDVSWERIYMTMKVVVETPLPENVHFYLAKKKKVEGEERYVIETEFQVKEQDGENFTLFLNITNTGINRCVRNSTYNLVITDEETVFGIGGYRGTSQQLEGWGRNFRYRSNVGIYTIAFMLSEYSEDMQLQLLFYNAVTRALGRIPHYRGVPVQDSFMKKVGKKLKKPFKKIKKKLKAKKKKFLGSMEKKVYDKIHKQNLDNKKTILFLSEQDDKPALNMVSIIERMKERGLDKEYDIQYSFRKKTSESYSKKSDIEMVKKVAATNMIIVDDHVPLFDRLSLAKDVTVIQIWHAGAGFKGVGYSRWGHYGCPGPFSCHRQYTYSISGSSYISHFFSEQFGILEEQVIPTGMPRMDQYLDPVIQEETKKRLYETYPNLEGKFVVLFAPTYRGQNRKKAFYPYELIDFDALYAYAEEKDAVILFKMHPWVPGDVPIEERHADRFISMNTYPNINELFYVTDLLITDYSSSQYEFSLMKKPMLFFAYDKVQYSTTRGFHRDYDSNVPGRVCTTFEEMLDIMYREDFQVEKVYQYVEDYFDNVDTHNSDRVIDWLIRGELPEEYKSKLEARLETVRNNFERPLEVEIGEREEEEEEETESATDEASNAGETTEE